MNALEQEPEKAKDTPEDDSAAAMLAMLGMGKRALNESAPVAPGKDSGGAAEAVTAVQQSVQNTTISKCGEPGGAEQDAQGIADILEGFGLLNGTADSAEADENVAMTPGTDTAAKRGTISRPDRGIPVKQAAAQTPEGNAVQSAQAGMLKEEPQIAAATGERMPDPLPREELSSFENINRPEVEPHRQITAQRQLPADALTADALAADKAAAVPAKAPSDIGTESGEERPSEQQADAKTPAQRAETFAGLPVFAAKSGAEVKSEPVAEASARQPILSKQLDGIVERIFTSSSEGKQEFEVELKPESLGKLSVKLVLDSDGMKAVIKTDNSATKHLLQNEVAALEQMLRDKGVDLSAISVTHEPASLGFTAQQRERGQQGGSHSHKRPVPGGIESYDSAMIAPKVEILPSNSSVEYMA